MNILPQDHLRCRRSNGTIWRCKEAVIEGDIYCQKHRDYFKHNVRLTVKAHTGKKGKKFARRGVQNPSQKLGLDVTIQGHAAVGPFDAATSSALLTTNVEFANSAPLLPSFMSTLESITQVSEVPTKKFTGKQKAKNEAGDFHETMASSPSHFLSRQHIPKNEFGDFRETMCSPPSCNLSVKGKKRTPKKAWAEEQVISRKIKGRKHRLDHEANMDSSVDRDSMHAQDTPDYCKLGSFEINVGSPISTADGDSHAQARTYSSCEGSYFSELKSTISTVAANMHMQEPMRKRDFSVPTEWEFNGLKVIASNRA